jgi:hypothetical protein
MHLRVHEQLGIVATGVGGGMLAYLASLYVLPPLPFSTERLLDIANQNLRTVAFIAGLSFQFFLSLLLGALLPALWVGFKRNSSVFLSSRLYSLGVLLLVTAASLGLLSGRNTDFWFSLYLVQVVIVALAAYGMVWLGAFAARLTSRSRPTR